MLEYEDVLVTAPTGSGKTWIAREEIRRLLATGRRAWYTTPLKALTNSKYQAFIDEFGAERVGILTGGESGQVTQDAVLILHTEAREYGLILGKDRAIHTANLHVVTASWP